ncbi:MAG: EamA family transporter [Leeuwenhoekiella sp.]|nr:MAG: EamA family transporter [Leeuwenhoekiella sp.]
MQSASLKDYLHLHLIVFIWGFTAVLGALISIGALELVWYRMGLASLAIFGYLKFKKIPLITKPKVLALMIGAGMLIALHWITFFGAIKMANVSVTLAMMSTGAFFTSILEPLFYKRKIIGYEIVFGLLVIVGLYLIFNVETRYTAGILVALLSALLAAFFTLINGKLVKEHHPVKISFFEMLSGAGSITVFLALTSRFDSVFFSLQASDWWYLAILALVCTAYAFIASVTVMRNLSPYTVMLTTNLEPVYGIILAFIILGDAERMHTDFYLGAVLILITVILNGIFKTRERKKRRLLESNKLT